MKAYNSNANPIAGTTTADSILGKLNRLLKFAIVLTMVSQSHAGEGQTEWPEYPKNPFVISLHPGQHTISARGGIIAADVNGDGLLDYLLSTKTNDYGDGKASIGAYAHDGEVLWIEQDIDLQIDEGAELPGLSGPGITVTDIEGDGAIEVLHLDTKNSIVIREGKTGKILAKISVPLPPWWLRFHLTLKSLKAAFAKDWRLREGRRDIWNALIESPNRWMNLQIVNLKGTYDDQVILQAGPFPFRWLVAYCLKEREVLWYHQEYYGCKHGGFRAADIDGDGYDEVVGAVCIEEDGTLIDSWSYHQISGHLDAISIADIRPDLGGLEWVVLEESHAGDDRTALLTKQGPLFYHSRNGDEPQNTAIGDFDTTRPGLEIWCRSRFNEDQRPWIVDGQGNTIAEYTINDVRPADWSVRGIEFIYPIDWEGSGRHLLAAKERHIRGKIALLEPLSGKFVTVWPEQAARLYVADVSGDSREEVIVVNFDAGELRVYWNNALPQWGHPSKRLWARNEYKRQKINYNYYSP